MKINRLETHDRLQHLIQDQSKVLFQGAEDCLKKNPLSLAIQDKSPYVYFFCIPRTLGLDEKLKYWSTGRYNSWLEVPEKKFTWDPRLGKPEAQENSYLFRAQSYSDIIEVCWLLPPMEMWDQYKKGNVTESDVVLWSISQYRTNKKALEAPHPEDMSEEKGRQIMIKVVDEEIERLRNTKLKSGAASSILLE